MPRWLESKIMRETTNCLSIFILLIYLIVEAPEFELSIELLRKILHFLAYL